MKRIFAFMLSVLLLCSMATPAVYAAYENSYSVLATETTQLKRGETFTVTASLTNAEPVCLGSVALFFDSTVFELIGGECLVPNVMLGAISLEENAGVFYQQTASAVSGDIFTFELKVKEDAPLGAVELTQKTSIALEGSNYIDAEGLNLEIVACTGHIFDQQVITDAYKATDATYDEPATYYYSCTCGEKGTETFPYGEAIPEPVVSKSVLTTQKTKLLQGETFTVTASLTNTELIKLGSVALFFDSAVFELIGGECLVPDTMLGAVYVPDNAGSFLTNQAVAVSGDIFTFELKVKEDAPLGAVELTQKTSIALEGSNYIDAEGLNLEIVACTGHIFDQQVITDAYKATDATYDEPATYYYSCTCGEKGRDTFAYGDVLARPDTYCVLHADTTALVRGETFSVTAKLTNKTPITLATVVLQYDDSILELTGGESLQKGTVLGTVVPAQKAGTMLFMQATVVSGDLFRFDFKVKDDAAFGAAVISPVASIGVGSGNYIAAEDLNLEIVCKDHSFGAWVDNGYNHKTACTICGYEKTEDHSFGDWFDVGTDHKAVCGACSAEKVAAHVFDKEIADETYLATAATCTAKAAYYYSCECGVKSAETFSYGEILPHTYDQEVVSEEYLATEATCTAKATYFYSCVCGEKNEETFAYGEMLDHTFDQKVTTETYLATAATCTAQATYFYSCQCGEKSEEAFAYGEVLPHTYDQEVASEEYLATVASCTAKATYYYSCVCGEKHTETFETGEYLPHEYENRVCANCQARLGDIDDSEELNTDDVVQLLLHISVPEMFPVGSATVDFDGDGMATTDDAIKLLLHISLPNMFPL